MAGKKWDEMLSELYTDMWGIPGSIMNKNSGSGEKKNAPDGEKSQFDVNLEEIRRINEQIQQEITRDFGKPCTIMGSGNDKKELEKKEEITEKSDKTATEAGGPAEEKEKEPEKDPMEELDGLIGMSALKDDVKELINLVKIQKMRTEQGLKTVPVSLHLVFTGNPGTGKTTIARILARLYKKIGVLSKGQLVEVDRSSIVAGYVGQTAIKTQEKIKEAMGGVLFIDEAYTLARGGNGGNDFGQEAIDTVLKAMEDHRDDLVVIVAGYPDLMKMFINSNPGLKSRFNKYIHFPDYSAEELLEIFKGQCKKYDYVTTEEAEKAVEEKIAKMVEEKDANFANARSVRNLFEELITNQATRVAGMENPDHDAMITITEEDIQSA